MSLGSPSETNSTFETDEDFSEISLFLLEEEVFGHQKIDLLESTTPLPTQDSSDEDVPSDPEVIDLTLESVERPETSTSSLFSFVDMEDEKPVRHSAPRLPTMIAPKNWNFYNSKSASESTLYSYFNTWMNDWQPRGGSFTLETSMEQLKNPRAVRSEPELPSLFKKRELGCGYCRSVGYSRWETHTRQRCERLWSLAPCKICGAHGEMNHTETYCPSKPPVILPLSADYIRDSDDRLFQRRSNHFHKYLSLIDILFSSNDSFF